MRVAVIGAGAIGSAVGALLARGGEEVTFVGRPDHVAAIRKEGLQVDGYLGEFTLRVDAMETLESRPDLALLAVKTQDVIPAVRANAAYLSGVPVVTLQNGVQSDELVAHVLPRSQIISVVVVMSATYLAAGHVTLIDRGDLLIGRPFGPNDAVVQEAARVLDKAMPTQVIDNIGGAHWTKLMINLNNCLPALTNLPIAEAFANPLLSRLAIRLISEGLDVTDRAGIQLEPIPSVRVESLRRLKRLPLRLAANRFAARARRNETGRPNFGSTLQSIKRGRPTEIDYLNGEVVRLGGSLGVPTPLNAKAVELVHRVERDGRFLSVAAIQAEVDGSVGR